MLTYLTHDDYLNFMIIYVRWWDLSMHSVYLVASSDYLSYLLA